MSDRDEGTWARDEGNKNQLYMKDPLDDLRFYQKALELWDLFWEDSEVLIRDISCEEDY